MQIQPYNDRIQLSLNTIAFTDNKERAAGMNLKEVYDKARRSRFLSDCKKEARYIATLRTYLFEHPWTISRIEGKAKTLLSGQISEECMNERFLQN